MRYHKHGFNGKSKVKFQTYATTGSLCGDSQDDDEDNSYFSVQEKERRGKMAQTRIIRRGWSIIVLRISMDCGPAQAWLHVTMYINNVRTSTYSVLRTE